MELRNQDLVLVSLSLRGRGLANEELDTVVKVGDLGLQQAGRQEAPQFDGATYARLIISDVPADREAAHRMNAEFIGRVAEFQAGGQQVTPGERLATGLVDWAVRTSPKGLKIVRTADEGGYVLNEREFNISASDLADGTTVWRVTAVATWGTAV